ncbi:hydrogenase maturation nickel metallochaperone HypA [Methylacidimicrobium sp. B4]|uniref:hydrogenase maturation nickel metallochaperone HypA n=1 Tax=Methylacidimicrobium sp. B4 TaxID=2796139 RepID=UPI001A8ECD0A|nr:hydrogenase maturation nickel metallochaperone HypA [Methylacidimicrobium sp. B4]QSR85294.1 hydrogenase maturation nickel metallochaperone HypA [Methylacidimicrobium sp. B4]
MHELALCRSILAILQEQAEQHHYKSVRRIELRVGPRAMVEPEVMAFSFGVASRGTLAEGALLEIRPVPAQAACLDCSYEGKVEKLAQACPRCGSYRLMLEEDIGLRLGEIEVD